MNKKMKFCLALSSVALMGQAHAEIYTLTATGTIQSMYGTYDGDFLGIFGGGDLTGKSFTWTETFDSSIPSASVTSDPESSSASLYSQLTSFVGSSLTVGGVTNLGFGGVTGGGSSKLSLQNPVTTGQGYGLDQIMGMGTAHTPNGVYAMGQVYGNSTAGFLPNLDFSQTKFIDGTTPGITMGGQEKYFSGLNSEQLNFGVQTLTLNGVAPIPEPETYAMLMAGLGLLGAVARRKK